MKLLLILSMFSISNLIFAQDKTEIEKQEESELSSYMKSNFIAEYVPKQTEKIEIKGAKRITLAYYSALMPSDFGTMTDYEFQFAYNLGHYWLETVIGQGTADFGTVGSNSSATSGTNSEGNFQRTDEAQEKYLYLGVGASLRSRHLSDLFGFNRVFETMHGYVTYHTLQEELRSEDYAGFGARADTSVNYLLSDSSHFGVKFSFGISALKRSQAVENETSSQRSLVFRWNRIGLDYSFYF
ncbi:MAG: hypothetical protein COW01_10760 [Bdellovibrionales bacterium CG12_big_fil_rev_8_21_14_0_65_38_15]|nr:MAG: hypothetical protein COW79_07605 [Bdellovibrionales bacterium CG22_combo_CG10-13_8_21_14_all_38_13]PIQ54616.1 MAG: hypothetical protein COW01_10760 [Bdellovibrionales bacterium CG12_big_fil_rev_8_21_14_0_65_38_15]PIR29997.1 MAG: hypothetical protein COV38_08605 [Bdellovibrionales bacterium CG11_big_fil_rev_8_21_14_0_20_38_13]